MAWDKKKSAKYNKLTGGFGSLTYNQLQNIQLPDKIRCSRCNKYKAVNTQGKENFSKKQLAEARSAVAKLGAKATIKISCVPCNGGQNVELFCTVCMETKRLAAFSKAQRRRPVEAKCLVCMDEQLVTDPDELKALQDAAEEKDGNDEFSDYDSDTDPEGSGNAESESITGDNSTSAGDGSNCDDTTTDYSNDTSSYFQSNKDSLQTSSFNNTVRSLNSGVALSQTDIANFSGWQTAGCTRPRKVVPSIVRVNGSANLASNPVLCVDSHKTNPAREFVTVPAYKAPSQARTLTLEPSEKKKKIEDIAWDSDLDDTEVAIHDSDSDDDE